MATVIHQQPVFVRPAPVTKKISVPTSKKRSREETVNKSEMMEKYSSDFAAYIKLETKFLASTSEVSALNTFQQMRFTHSSRQCLCLWEKIDFFKWLNQSVRSSR